MPGYKLRRGACGAGFNEWIDLVHLIVCSWYVPIARVRQVSVIATTMASVVSH